MTGSFKALLTPPSHDKGSTTAQVGVTTHRRQAQPLETARVGSLSQYVHEGVPTPRDQARVRNQKISSVRRCLHSSSPTPDGDQEPSSLLLRSLSFPHHGLAMGYSHTRLFLWDFVEGSTGRTTENVHVSRSLGKYHQGSPSS